MAEDVLVDLSLHFMTEDYRINLESLFFSSFSRLMETARCTNELVRKTSRSSSLIRSSSLVRTVSKKRTMITIIEKGKGARFPVQRKHAMARRRPRNFQFYRPFVRGEESHSSP